MILRRSSAHIAKRPQSGFTIVELMIATSVLSVILVMVSVLLINIGNLFYKGVNQVRVQNSARAIADDLSDHIKYSGALLATATPHIYAGKTILAYCTGGERYSYIIDKEQNVDINHALWRDDVGSAACTPLNITLTNPGGTNGTDLLNPNTRLTALTVAYTSAYQIVVGLAYGDTSLTAGIGHGLSTTCQGGYGDQFCATATLTTYVTTRIAAATP